MIAIILAAGVARRLAPLTDRTQKSLLPVGGRPMLLRMLEALHAEGVPRALIVVGHCADQVEAMVARAPRGLDVRLVPNPDYVRGSSLSLYRTRDTIRREPTLIMDADVVFPREMLRRLLAARARNAILSDGGFTDTGEEVKVYTRAGRVIALSKKIVPAAWDTVGEGIGFFRCSAPAGAALLPLLEQVIADSAGMCEYEEAVHLLMSRRIVRAVDVTGLPWTEVDFVEDLHRAEAEVLPRILRLEGPPPS